MCCRGIIWATKALLLSLLFSWICILRESPHLDLWNVDSIVVVKLRLRLASLSRGQEADCLGKVGRMTLS